MNPAKQAMLKWEAEAIEKCRNDPRLKELGICYVCMCEFPCLCQEAAEKKRATQR